MRGGRQHLRLDHLGLGIADGIDAAHPAVADMAQDRTDGGGARVDIGVDRQRPHQRHQRRVVHQRDRHMRPGRFRPDRGQEVRLVVIGHAQHGIGAFDPRLAQQLHVEPVAMQHDGPFQRVRRDLGPAAVGLDHAGSDALLRFSSVRATLSPTLPPPMTITRSAVLAVLPKISSVRSTSSVWVKT
jgi:hypothetical protein